MSRRHAGFVRVTHWLTSLAFAALFLSGVEVLLSHPRFAKRFAGSFVRR